MDSRKLQINRIHKHLNPAISIPMSSSLAIIPARGGSKRIPRKNIRAFHGKPMIAWSIDAALESKAFDAVMVSTDDDEIAAIAKAAGAIIPFRRPLELSGDHSATMPVLAHAIEWWQKHRSPIEFACCLYATAPFIKPNRLAEGMRLLRTSRADFILTVAKFSYPVQRSLRLTEQNILRLADPENALKRSQDLEPRYHDAGQFFAGRVKSILRHESVLFGQCLPLVVPSDEAVDIDTEEDWQLAEKLHSLKRR